MSAPETAVTVIDRKTGEVLSVREVNDERLAEFVTNVEDLKADLSYMEGLVNAEIVRRLDRNASWTLHVGDPTVRQWEIKSSSSADVDTYPADLLEPQLRSLITEDVISETAAEAALKRTLTVEFVVPFQSDKTLDELAKAIKGAATISIDGVTLKVAKATTDRKAIAAGIAKLRKVPGAIDALDAAKVTHPAGDRRATVKLKQAER